MAEPPSSSSSESGEEKVDEYSNTFDEEDTQIPAKLNLSSESDSDTDIPPRSLFSIFKPGHVPGTGSCDPVSVSVHSESGIKGTDKKDVSLEEIDSLSADQGDEETKDETETMIDKVAMKLTDQDPDDHSENSVEQIKQGSTEASQHAETADMNPVFGQSSTKPTPLPKPVFRVVNNRKLISDTRQNEEQKTKKDVCDDIQIKEDSGTPSTKSPGEEVYNLNRQMHTDKERDENIEVTGITLKSAENLDPEISTVNEDGEDNIFSKRYVGSDDSDFKTSLTGVGSFEVLEDSDREELFSTPKEHLSGCENDELDELVTGNTSNDKLPLDILENPGSLSAINAQETSANSGGTSIEGLENRMKKDKEELNEVDQSFVVIGKGSLKDSKHGYKSISSSVSESDLQKSVGNSSTETDNINDDNAGSRLSFTDKLKLFEGDLGDHSHQETKTSECNVKPCKTEVVQSSDTEATDTSVEKDSSYISEPNDTNDEFIPTVPPKSAVVMEELESMRSVNQDADEGSKLTHVSSARNIDTSDQFGSDATNRKQEQREDANLNNYATQGTIPSIPHSQSQPDFPANPWAYYQPYPMGYSPASLPYFDAETLKRMSQDPSYSTQLMLYQYMYQQQLFRQGQGPVERHAHSDSNLEVCKDKQGEMHHVAAEHIEATYKASEIQSQYEVRETDAIHNDGPSQRRQLDKTGRSTETETREATVEPEVHPKTKQRDHPVPKPRRSVARQKPHQSLPHVEKSRTPPVKDTGISQPSTKVPETKTTQPLSHSVEVEPKTEKRQPRHFVHRQRIQPVSSAASQAKKVDHKGRQIPAEKGSKNRPSLSPEKKPATRTEEVKEKPKEDTFIYVKNICPKSSTENLENFLEGGIGNEAEVKEGATIYSRDQTEALITFIGKPEMAELKKRCSQRSLDDSYLTVCEVPAPTCIAVSSDADIPSNDALTLYFELKRNGGGELATEEVLKSSDASCRIIEFESAEVVKNLCSGRHHLVSDVTLKVSPYYKCELGEIWNTSLHYIPLPEPQTIQITKTQIQFLSRQCCQELKEELSHKFADMELIDTGVTVKCTLTQRTPNCRSLARAWQSDVSKVFDSFWTKLSEKTLIVKNHVWEGVTDFLEKGELNTDTVLIEQQKEQCRVLLYGFTVDVEGAYDRLSCVMNEVDRKVRRTQDTVSLKYAGRGRLLHKIRTLKEIEGLFTDLSIELDGNALSLRGVQEDISEAKLKIHEANSEIVSETFEHGFSSALVDFLNQIHHKNDVVYSVNEKLEKAGVTAEIEITYKKCLIFVPPGNQCQAVQDTIIELVKEDEIALEKESLPLLKEQIWVDLKDDLTERYKKTANVTTPPERDRVHIIGLKKIVDTAKKQIERFMEENTIKTDLFPIDSLSHKFIKRYSTEEVKGIQRNLSEHHVVIKVRERDVQVKGTKEGLKLAKQELSQLFSKIRNKDHTFQKVGVTEAMGNIAVQLSDIETKTRCIIETPEMSGSTYLRQDPYQPEDSGAATRYDLEDEDDMGKTSSSVDEPPGFKAKNGLLINIVKGEIGKQEGGAIICATSPNLNLASGAAGKSLLREGGDTLQDECKEIVANQENIKPGEIVKIRGGRIECKHIYLTLLPNWRDDSSSLQILEDIVRDSLKMASNDNLVSILFCALGTGGLKYPASAVASVMYSKVLEFDAANPDTSLKEVKFVLYQKDTPTIQAFEKEERDIRFGKEKVSYDLTFQNTSVSLVVEQLATQKVDCILCTTNKDMNLKASGACQTLLTVGGPALQDECKNKYGNNLPEGQVVEITAGNLKCKSVFLTTLPAYEEGKSQILKSVVKTTLGEAQVRKYKSLACIALGTGYLKYPGAIAAESMYTAVEEFVAANPGTRLQLVKFVMHAKDIKTIEAFKAYIRRNNRVSTNRKDRKLEEDKHGRNRETNRDYNAFHDGCRIRNTTLKVVIGDILEQNTEGIVNSVNDEFEFLGGVASALKKRCPGLEQESQRKATKMKFKGIVITDQSTHKGNLKAEFIIHIAFQKSSDRWKSKFHQCLNKADKKKMKSLSFPVLGTGAGQQTFKAEDIAGALFGAIDEFSAAQRLSRLREVRLVIFHKQKYTMGPVIKSLHKNIQAAVMSRQQKSSGWMSRLKDYTTKKVSEVADFLSSSGNTSRQEQHSQKDTASIKKEISSINLKIYSDDINNIDNCIQELDRALEEEYTDYTLKDYIDLIKSLTKAEMDKLEQIECVVNMNIDQNAGIIRIQGPKKFVLDAQTELHKCLKDFERQRQMQEEAETLYQQIQWQFEEVKLDGIELVPYDKMTNLKIETAYKNKNALIELIDSTDRTVYVVDFMSLEEYIKGDKDNSATVVVRKDILKTAKQPLPAEWTVMKEDENIRITNLLASDPRYQQIEKRFVTEVTSGQYNNKISSMKNVKVTKIDLIQNKALYQQYMAKKDLMTKQTPNPPAQFPIERTVWHGTSQAAVSSIQVHGFNRSYAGDKNGVPWYGYGVYFAADASYSARSWLTGANPSGNGTTKGYIFLAKALTGEFCKGEKGKRFLPAKNPSNPTDLYDCAVDDVANPMEFVIFHDAQAYPEYLITFVS